MIVKCREEGKYDVKNVKVNIKKDIKKDPVMKIEHNQQRCLSW